MYGFTLLEVLLALAISAVIAAGLLVRQQAAVKQVQESLWYSQAGSLLLSAKQASGVLPTSQMQSQWFPSWQQAVENELPHGVGELQCGSVCVATVQWRAYGNEHSLCSNCS